MYAELGIINHSLDLANHVIVLVSKSFYRYTKCKVEVNQLTSFMDVRREEQDKIPW